ncbi:DUF6683 family protein [Hymenobacter jeollabukensis]|uniref:DUF4197 domain-containing protein n=1 Tax=Hymenobacter jeollabukensis TaxID=2025313 RepID=A0A5R8WPS9_9BACT|nr:DUF6683 family protein [Hymenobacter jeollabukensis]TLM92308.1 hypothetical protein FDY95_12805 [Hymenobacter jeollabukensis]
MKTSVKACWVPLLSFGLLLGAQPAVHAQQSVDLIMDNFTSSVLSQTTTLLANNAIEASVRNANRSKGASGRTSTATKATSTTYSPSATARQQALAAQNEGKPAAAAQQFTAAFGPGGTTDYTTLYRQLLSGSGLRENDVADAYAAYLVATYQVAHGAVPGEALLPAGKSGAVRTQLAPAVRRSLAGKPATTAAALGEYMKLQTALLYVGSQGAPNTQPAFRRNVASTLQRRFGLDVNALTLTNQGFARK